MVHFFLLCMSPITKLRFLYLEKYRSTNPVCINCLNLSRARLVLSFEIHSETTIYLTVSQVVRDFAQLTIWYHQTVMFFKIIILKINLVDIIDDQVRRAKLDLVEVLCNSLEPGVAFDIVSYSTERRGLIRFEVDGRNPASVISNRRAVLPVFKLWNNRRNIFSLELHQLLYEILDIPADNFIYLFKMKI